jgi:Na+-driven multidrug efflux pump
VAAGIWPESWLRLFDTDPAILASGSTYLRIVGPFYGFYGLGFALYFAAQGAGRLLWPLLAGLLGPIVAALGGWFVLSLTGSEGWLYAALALGPLLYGPVITATTATSYRSQHTSCPGNVLAQETDLVGVSVGHVQKRL